MEDYRLLLMSKGFTHVGGHTWKNPRGEAAGQVTTRVDPESGNTLFQIWDANGYDLVKESNYEDFVNFFSGPPAEPPAEPPLETTKKGKP